jgi:hypothetical protein
VTVESPEASKFSRYSPVVGALFDSVAKLGVVFSYASEPPLPAAEN